jgi:hypothetical protein
MFSIFEKNMNLIEKIAVMNLIELYETQNAMR